MAIKFRTQYDSTKEFISEPGSHYLDQYGYKFDDKGEVIASTLHKLDKPKDVWSEIQAAADSCDINLLMERFAKGDSSALDVRTGAYIDATKMPTTYAELFQKVNDTHAIFDNLPTDVKELFDNSYEEFWSEYGSDIFFKKIDDYNDRFVDHSFDVSDDVVTEGVDEVE